MPIALWLPLVVVALVCWSGAASEVRSSWSAAVRSDPVIFGGYALAVVAVSAVLLVPAAVAQLGLMAAVVRNVAGLVGVALVLRRWSGGVAASATTAGFLAVSALLGANPDGSATWWAWPVADHLGPLDGVLAVTLLGAGLVATVAPPGWRPAWSGPLEVE